MGEEVGDRNGVSPLPFLLDRPPRVNDPLAMAYYSHTSKLSLASSPYAAGFKSYDKAIESEPWLEPLPVYVVTEASALPCSFLNPSPEQPLVIGFDCEGVDLARDGRLCIMQLAFGDAVYLVDAVEGKDTLMQACKPALESPFVTKVVHDCKRDAEALFFQHGIKLSKVFDTQVAYALIEEQKGEAWSHNGQISFVDLLADKQFCGVVYGEKEQVRILLRKDPKFWAHRPLTEMMKRVAADDVRFLLRIHENMTQMLKEHSKWLLEVRGALHCRCFCIVNGKVSDWPAVPPLPEHQVDEEEDIQENIMAVVDVPSGQMGRIIGKKGASILSIKKCCRAHIFTGGTKGPPDKVFVIGALKEVCKAKALLRGRIM